MKLNIVRVVVVLFLISLTGCLPGAEFDQSALDQAISIKSESITLMNKATESFALYRIESDSLKAKVESAYNYSSERVNNSESTSQWRIMKDPVRSLLFGFLERWEQRGHLSREFITEADTLVAEGFEAIINLELSKKKIEGGAR